jgi:putative spermidine/putrescine transport system ATP-binding protein
VALARALAVQPSVLLLDEPLSALDAKVRVQLRAEIRRLQTEMGVTTIFVTHDQEEALAISDRVGVMSHGRLEQIDVPAAVYDRPSTGFVARFVGRMNEIPGTVVEHGAVRVNGTVLTGLRTPSDVRPGDAVLVMARPEHVRLQPPDAAGDGVPVQIVGASFHGPRTELTARVAATDATIVIDLPSADALDWPLGGEARASLRADRVLVEPADGTAGGPAGGRGAQADDEHQ